tara:strand:- start:38 stop:235 length:198 start_codon:yes stop_codon:yes gene_type:complete
MTRVKIKVNHNKDEIVMHCEKDKLNIGYYDTDGHIEVNIHSIPKIIDSLLFVHNMETRLNKEESN